MGKQIAKCKDSKSFPGQRKTPARSLPYRLVKCTRKCKFSSVQSFSHVRLFATPWTTAREVSLSITISQSLPKPMSIESVMPSNHLILCCPLLLPSIFPSIRVFSTESALHIRWPKYWSFSFNVSNQDWSPLGQTSWISLQSKGLSRVFSTPQFKRINSSALSFLYSPTLTSTHDHWKNIALTRWTLVDKVMSLLFNMLSRLVITFLSRSKCLLISWLQSPSSVILEPRKIKSGAVSTVSPSICHEMQEAVLLLDYPYFYFFLMINYPLGSLMATHSSILAWKIPWTG